MNLIFTSLKLSIKVELFIAISILAFLVFMPIMGVFALTHVDTTSKASSMYDATSYPGDLYAWGNCTWWVSIRRSQIGEPIPNSWGNAATWASRAQQDGYVVDHTPSYGAIMQISNVDGGLGHVAFVESVDPDGTWHISEMNVLGLDIIDYKAEVSSDALNYNFIHLKNGL
jgi:peptidoglycan endopeptidase LytE